MGGKGWSWWSALFFTWVFASVFCITGFETFSSDIAEVGRVIAGSLIFTGFSFVYNWLRAFPLNGKMQAWLQESSRRSVIEGD